MRREGPAVGGCTTQGEGEGGGEGLADVREDVKQERHPRVGVVDEESVVNHVDGDLHWEDEDSVKGHFKAKS